MATLGTAQERTPSAQALSRLAKKPSLLRQQHLAASTETNEQSYRDPYFGVRIETIGELLWIILKHNWRGGLTEAGEQAYGRYARWFVKARRAQGPVDSQQPANLRFAILSNVPLKHANLELANLFAADLRDSDLSDSGLPEADVRGARWEGVTLSGTKLVSSSREETLLAAVQQNMEQGQPKYRGIGINSTNDLLWILRNGGRFLVRSEQSANPIDLRGADFQNASISDVDLRDLDLSGTVFLAPERASELELAYDKNTQEGSPPYANVLIKSRGEILWILNRRRWTGLPLDGVGEPANFREVNFITGDFTGICLRRADLSGATIRQATLINAAFEQARLTSAVMDRTNLSGSDLRHALLTRSSLNSATLSGATLAAANVLLVRLRGAICDSTDFRGANLTGVKVNSDTTIADIRIDNHTKFGSINWSTGVSLLQVDWSQAPLLGEEVDIDRGSQQDRIKATHIAVVAYHGLSIALRQQGMITPAGAYRIREEQLQRKIFAAEGRPLAQFGSWLLDNVAGYGEKPSRVIRVYLVTIVVFATVFLGIGMIAGPHISPTDTLVFSMASFHGRGFFPNPNKNGITLDNPITSLAALEAVIGVVIEATFVASFVHRFLRST